MEIWIFIKSMEVLMVLVLSAVAAQFTDRYSMVFKCSASVINHFSPNLGRILYTARTICQAKTQEQFQHKLEQEIIEIKITHPSAFKFRENGESWESFWKLPDVVGGGDGGLAAGDLPRRLQGQHY